MDKNFLKDTIPSTHSAKKSIRNIPLSENASRKAEKAANETHHKMSSQRIIKRNRKMSYGTPWKKITLVLAIVICIGYFAFSFVNAKTTITLTPQSMDRSIDLAYNIYNVEIGRPETTPSDANTEDVEVEDGNQATEENVTSSLIPFTTREVSVTQSKSVPASGEEAVEDKARGTITIYNEYSTEPQQLITNTRFESPDGKIYRIQKAVIIPGMIKNSNGDEIPGTLSVDVVADEAGLASNQDQVGIAFTVPGLANTAQYETTYAKSTTPITGGFSGVRKVVSQQDEENTREELRSDLEQSIVDAIEAENNEDFFVTYNPEMITYSSLSDAVDGDSVVISERATVTGIAFEMNTLNSTIASDALGSGSSENLIIDNITELQTQIENPSNFDPLTSDLGVIRFIGNAKFVADISSDEIKESTAGMSKSELKSFLEKADGVKRARIAITPFWKQSVSNNTDKVNVIISADENQE